jgi:hypothetical protein
MNKLLIVAALLLCSINTFHIYDAVIAINQNNLKDIDWPFTNCGKGTWDIEKLTLGGTPARNTNDDITVVTFLLSRLELPTMTSTLCRLISMSSLTESSSTVKQSPSSKTMRAEITSNLNTPTSSQASLPQEPTVSPSTSKQIADKMDAWLFHSNFDRTQLSYPLHSTIYFILNDQ